MNTKKRIRKPITDMDYQIVGTNKPSVFLLTASWNVGDNNHQVSTRLMLSEQESLQTGTHAVYAKGSDEGKLLEALIDMSPTDLVHFDEYITYRVNNTHGVRN